jgi:transcriptional regulator with XRE-family HTH domain
VNTFSEVWRKLSNRKYRSAFARTQFKRLVPLQIQALRRQRGLSQEALAEQARLTQGVISRAEDQDYGNLTVNTILSVADGLDVAFVGRFVRFSELGRWYIELSQEAMRVPSFDEENEAMIAPGEQANAMAAAGGKQHADVRFGNLIILDGARTEMAGKGQSSLHGLECMLLTAKPRGGSANAASGGATR